MSIRQDAIKHAIVASLFKTRNREFKETAILTVYCKFCEFRDFFKNSV